MEQFERESARAPFTNGKRLKREMGERYLQILDAIDDKVLVKGPHSKIVWANRAFREYYGMTNEQLGNLIDAPFNRPDFTQQYVKDDAYVFESGKVLDIPREQVTRHDGEVRTFHTVKSPIFDSSGKVILTVGVARDITEQEAQERLINEQRIEMAKQKSEARYRALFETMTEGLIVGELIYNDAGVAVDHRYLEVNPACERYFGRKAVEIVGLSMRELFPGAETFSVARYARVVETGEPTHFEVWFAPLERWFEVRAYRTEPRKFAAIFNDISDRKDKEAALLAAKSAAESLARLKTRFLDIAAHELRTPVTGLCLSLQAAQLQYDRTKLRPDEHTLRRLRRLADRLSRLVVDLLDVSRMEHGMVQIQKKPADIVTLVSECAENFRQQVPDRKIEVRIPGEPIQVEIDPMRIYQVVSNFVDNAIKYTPEGTPIEIRVDSLPDRVRVSVSDEGPGISEERQKTLFDAFERGGSDQELKSPGLGLGLFISSSIMKMHGGKIEVKSQPGKGSTFSIEFQRPQSASRDQASA